MVTSWSPGKQDVLELFVQPRRGLTARLQACVALEGLTSFSAFVSGPHGLSEPISQYESVLVIASGYGIAGVIAYLKQLLHSYNTTTSRVQRVHFVWQIEMLGEILEMSFYVVSGIKMEDKTAFGEHNRAVVYGNMPNYRKIISSEASGDYIPRLPNTNEERGELLVLGRLFLPSPIEDANPASFGVQ
ncbi:hypothetical protein D8B26_005414 [Coccidioides posadasii str. Silveira]|uniref:uncharacterized protein n=1 Tax=Coccidioides posadasii (strain RMSCC 757 / Silveira) TaxID=443226 RepID=UPI001BF176BE|nr:hypothetical protein D8B26_005414 [Coccidioides posadasii str. Silveira]